MKNLVLFTVFSILPLLTYSQVHDSVAIDSFFMEWDQPNSPGCAIGIIKDGKLIFGRGYGKANLEYNIPNSTKTVFRIGSTSKQFTAACIVLLEEQGKLKFEDKLSKFFPDFPEYADDITILQLLNHSSGIRDYLTLSYLAGLSEDDFYTDEDVMKLLINQKENNFAPNDEYLYSNSGYWLLGQIVKKISGRNMALYAKENLFDPLGMQNTHFHNDHTQIVINRASGYSPKENGYRISMTTLDMIGDGGTFTTIEDLKIWDDNFYKSTVLSTDFWSTMRIPLVLNNGKTEEYAKGIMIGDYKGLKTLSHGGGFVGFRAEMIRFPEQRTSIILLANRDDVNPTAKAFQVADIVLKDHFPTNKLNTADPIKSKPTMVKLSAKQLEKFCASYWNSDGSYSRKIYLKNDTLRYFRSVNSESKLVPVSKSEFKMLGVAANLMVNFSENESGQKIMSVTIDGGSPIRSVNYEPISYSLEQLQKYSGAYYSKELDSYYELKIINDSLFLFLNGKQKSSVNSIMANLLSNDDYGLLDFRESENGVTGFKLMAGRVINLRFVKQ